MRHPVASRVRTISSAAVEFTGRPRKVPLAVLVDETHAASPRTATRSGLRASRTARANYMSAARWCDRYSSRDSAPPLSSTTASGARRASAAAVSPEASAR
jgi:hypothetical protein